MSFRALVLFLLVLMPTLPALAQPVIDGQIDPAYGQPIAADPLGDYVGESIWDLGALHVTNDTTYLYLAFTIAGDISANPYGKYVLYIDTTNDSAGASVDPWMRNVVVADPHKPEYGITTWLDAPPYGTSSVELWHHQAGWSNQGTITAAASSASTTGSVIEWKIERAALGDPQTIWLEVYSTGKESTDNAQDTITSPADDFNAPSGDAQWTALSTLTCSAQYVLTTPAVDAGPALDAAIDSDVDSAPPPPDSAPPPPDSAPPPPDSTPPPPQDSAPEQDSTPPQDSASPSQEGAPTTDGAPTPADSGPADDAKAGDGVKGERQDEGCGCGASGTGSSNAALALPLLVLLLVNRRRTAPASPHQQPDDHQRPQQGG